MKLIHVKANITYFVPHAHKTESDHVGQALMGVWLFPTPAFFRGPDLSFRTPWFPQKLTWDVYTVISCSVFWVLFGRCVQNLLFPSHQILSQIFHASFWNNLRALSSVCNPSSLPSFPWIVTESIFPQSVFCLWWFLCKDIQFV